MNLGTNNTIDGTNAFWVRAGELNLGKRNKMTNAGVTVELGQVYAGEDNRASGLWLLNKAGQCNLGIQNTTNNYRFTNNGQYNLGKGNNINIGTNGRGSNISIRSSNNVSVTGTSIFGFSF